MRTKEWIFFRHIAPKILALRQQAGRFFAQSAEKISRPLAHPDLISASIIMKKTVSVLLAACMAVCIFTSCGHSDAPGSELKEETNTTIIAAIEEMTAEDTTVECLTTDASTTQAPKKTLIETTTPEAAPEDWKDWQKKALAVMQSVEVAYSPELTGITFTLRDLSQDGIPEIIEDLAYIEWYDGPQAIWTWYNGDYVPAYVAGDDHQIQSISAYRNTQTGKIELWDLGNIDFELKDYYPESPDSGGLSEVFGPYNPINDHIRRLEFTDGKLRITQSHDELKNFATYGMPDEEVKRAWEALHRFAEAFWKTHDREPVKIHSKSLEFLQFDWQFGSDVEDVSALIAETDLPPERRYYGNDFYSNMESKDENGTYIYNRDHLRKIIEEY